MLFSRAGVDSFARMVKKMKIRGFGSHGLMSMEGGFSLIPQS